VHTAQVICRQFVQFEINQMAHTNAAATTHNQASERTSKRTDDRRRETFHWPTSKTESHDDALISLFAPIFTKLSVFFPFFRGKFMNLLAQVSSSILASITRKQRKENYVHMAWKIKAAARKIILKVFLLIIIVRKKIIGEASGQAK